MFSDRLCFYRHYVDYLFFFFNDTATTEIYTLSLHDALPILNPVPCEPTSTTSPEVSRPRMCGNSTGIQAFMSPRRIFQSTALTLLADTRTLSSPAAALGSGTSRNSSLSTSPYPVSTIAFTTASLFVRG